MTRSFLFGLIFSLLTPSAFSAEKKELQSCHPAKEFITSAEFLKKEKVYPSNDTELRKISLEITQGCSDSAKRFIDVFQTLDKAGFPRKTSIKTALEFTKKSNDQAQVFCTSFQKAYLKKYLDLTPMDAYNVAFSLSKDAPFAAKDFEKMVAFCTNNKQVDLPKKYCADQSLKLAEFSGKYGDSLFSDFKSLYFWFLENSKEDIPAPKALAWALNVVQYGPDSKENFLKSLAYIEKKSDFPMTRPQAIQLALQITQNSHQ